jgi:hypothetical protein
MKKYFVLTAFLALGLVSDMKAVSGASIDSDNDGIPDDQEALLGSDPRRADTDGDGQNDGAELRAGTDPKSAASAFKILSGPRLVSGSWQITWSSVPGKNYKLQRLDGDRIPFGPLIWSDAGAVSATGPQTSVSDASSSGSSQKYYRVVLVESNSGDLSPPVIGLIRAAPE